MPTEFKVYCTECHEYMGMSGSFESAKEVGDHMKWVADVLGCDNDPCCKQNHLLRITRSISERAMFLPWWLVYAILIVKK